MQIRRGSPPADGQISYDAPCLIAKSVSDLYEFIIAASAGTYSYIIEVCIFQLKQKFSLHFGGRCAKISAVKNFQRKESSDLPNIKSSKKSVKLDAKRHARNVAEKTRMKKAQKLVLAAIAQKDALEAQKLLPAAHKAIDQAAANNTIHKNAAARKKSRLTLKVNAISA